MGGKNSSIPRHKRMKRPARIQAAPHWIPTYTGKNIVRGYARHFGVDLICAVVELEIIGYKFTSKYKCQLEKDKENRIKQKQSRKRARQGNEMTFWSDDTFSFIAGYTSGGAPYGVTWEEMNSNKRHSDKNYLFEVQVDNKGKDEIEEIDLDQEDSGLFLKVKERDDGKIPF